MTELARTGVSQSMRKTLLHEFDRLIAKRGYKNRSEAFRDLIREALLTETVDSNKPVVGTLTLVYDHHVPNLSEKLTASPALRRRYGSCRHPRSSRSPLLSGSGHHEGQEQGAARSSRTGCWPLRGVDLGKPVLTNSGKELKHAQALARRLPDGIESPGNRPTRIAKPCVSPRFA